MPPTIIAYNLYVGGAGFRKHMAHAEQMTGCSCTHFGYAYHSCRYFFPDMKYKCRNFHPNLFGNTLRVIFLVHLWFIEEGHHIIPGGTDNVIKKHWSNKQNYLLHRFFPGWQTWVLHHKIKKKHKANGLGLCRITERSKLVNWKPTHSLSVCACLV